MDTWFAHYRQLHKPTQNLDAAEREMIAVSMENGCLYCLVAHGAVLRQVLGDPILAERITLDHRRAGLDERHTAILDFAVKITERPLDCDPEDLERLQGFGLTEEEVWDVIETSCSRYKPWDEIARSAGGGRHSADRTDQRLGETEALVARSVWSGSSPRRRVVGLRGSFPAADFIGTCEVSGVGYAGIELATSAV